MHLYKRAQSVASEALIEHALAAKNTPRPLEAKNKTSIGESLNSSYHTFSIVTERRNRSDARESVLYKDLADNSQRSQNLEKQISNSCTDAALSFNEPIEPTR